jgi:hypothetical protein
MKTTIIKLDRKDDIVSIKDKMVWGKTSRIIFVVPKRGRVNLKELDLVLLRRNSEQLGVEIALVSRNNRVTSLATRIGIPVFSDIDQAQKRLWNDFRTQGNTFSGITKSRMTTDELDSMRYNLPERKKNWTDSIIIRWTAFIFGMASVLALLALFIPKARVVIDLTENEQTLNLPVWASTRISRPNPSGGLPTHEITTTITLTEEIPSSGQTSWNQGYSEGMVVVTNNTTGDVEIPQGTIFLTSGQLVKRYILAEAQVLSVDEGTISLPVKAVEQGPQYNIDPGEIQAVEGQLGLFISASNPAPFTGGGAHQVRAPIEQDYLDLRERILAQAASRGIEEIQSQLLREQIILPASVMIDEIISESFQPALETPSDVLTMTMKVNITGLYYNQSDLESVVRFALDANLGENNAAVAETMKWHESSVPEAEDDVYRWEVFAERQIWQGWQPDVLSEKLAGKDLSSAKAQIKQQYALEAVPSIQVSPDWWPWLPFLSFNIHLEGR